MNSHRSGPIKSDPVNLFGDLGIKASWQLPQAYRNLVRPSSVLSTKASTVCINVEYFLLRHVHVTECGLAFLICLLCIKLRRPRIHISRCKACLSADGWTRAGSNRLPPRCKRGILPAELRARFGSI